MIDLLKKLSSELILVIASSWRGPKAQLRQGVPRPVFARGCLPAAPRLRSRARFRRSCARPEEGAAASNGARGGPLGGPKWSDAKVAVAAGAPVSLELSMWNP